MNSTRQSTYIVMSILFLSGITARADVEAQIGEWDERGGCFWSVILDRDKIEQIEERNKIRSRVHSDTITLGNHLCAGNVALANAFIKKALEYKNEHECSRTCNAELEEYLPHENFYRPQPNFCDKQNRLLSTALMICAEKGLVLVDHDLMIKLLDKLAIQSDWARTYRGESGEHHRATNHSRFFL